MASTRSPSKRVFFGRRGTRPSTSNTGNQYEKAHIGGRANAILGNVQHAHFYSHGALTPRPGTAEEYLGGSATSTEAQYAVQIRPQSISDYDHEYAHSLRRRQRIEDTCNWLLRSAEFNAWSTQSGPPVFVCVGSLGCGKSILTSAVIDWLYEQRERSTSPVVSFYVDTTRTQATTSTEILRALIAQLFDYHRYSESVLPLSLDSNMKSMLTSPSSGSFHNLVAIIGDYLQLSPSSFLVIDGVDSLAEQEIIVFMGFLRALWPAVGKTSPGRLLLSCRETLGRCVRIDSIPSSVIFQIKLAHLRSDLHRYVDHEVEIRQAERPITSDSSLIQEVKDVLKTNSEKMFLWIYLQLLNIWDPGFTTCDQDIRYQLKALPDGLEDIYMRCLFRIHSTNNNRSREIAPRVFKWIASAHQPLTPAQAREAASMTPDNLPLQRDQLLNNPVTDYCANLVVVDDLTGTIKFPHPSVKDFLTDVEKLPAELAYLRLSTIEDDLWCGKICLAHAILHHSRQQLVQYRTQSLDVQAINPIISNILGPTLSFGLRKLISAPSDTTSVRIPIPAINRDASAVTHLHLHNYMCKGWLSHNISIDISHSNYIQFEDLCLSHDSDLQPWATTNSTNTEHYQRMTFHAVMTNHPPLLKLVLKHLREVKGLSCDRVIYSFVSGTGSTILHCAVALGYIDIVKVLLEYYPTHIVDDTGKSAVIVAIETRQYEVLKALLGPMSFTSWPVRTVDSPFDIWSSNQEYPLDVCAKYGYTEATEIILRHAFATRFRDRVVSRQQFIDDTETAFFLACTHGNLDTCRVLARYVVDVKSFTPSHIRRVISLQGRSSRPVLRVALQLRNLKMMETLLELDRSISLEDNDFVLIYVLKHLHCNFQEAEPFVQLLLRYDKVLRRVGPTWFEDLIIADRLPHLSDRDRNHYLRLILQFPGSLEVPLPGAIDEVLLVRWMHQAPDDVLMQLLSIGLFEGRFLFSPRCLMVGVRRDTSRYLEAVLNLFLRTDHRKRGSWSDRLPVSMYIGPCQVIETMLQILKDDFEDFEDIHHFPLFLRDAILEHRQQILEFFFSYGPKSLRDVWHVLPRGRPSKFLSELPKVLAVYHGPGFATRFPFLMWMRCYSKMKGDKSATAALCTDLQKIGADGNFALNVHQYFGNNLALRYHLLSRTSAVWLALHRWNFRLNRLRRKRLSESDAWYMAVMLTNHLNNGSRPAAIRLPNSMSHRR